MSQLTLKSHVGRDLLQTSQLFKNERLVVWEYVVNSLQYHDPRLPPQVSVVINEKQKAITISDNGLGMDRDGLAHFFTMHAENRERQVGRIGRGLFGTGKSAAFGIASELRITTTRNGLRNTVTLTRSAVEAATDGTDVPLVETEVDVQTQDANGTTVVVSDIHLKRIDRDSVVQYIERRLWSVPRDAEVYVGAHRCAFREPEVYELFEFEPTASDRATLGSAKLVIKVAKSILETESQGIQVFSHGNWVARTLAGIEGREMTEFIFGELDVPAIEEYSGPIPPFDLTRSGELNGQNEVVAALYRFVGPHLDDVRRRLVARKRDAAKSEQARQLAAQAQLISNLLSQDFAEFRLQLQRAQAVVSGRDPGARAAAPLGGDQNDEDAWVEGGEQLADVIDEPNETTSTEEPSGEMPPDLPTPVVPSPAGTTTGRPGGGSRQTPTGGIDVEYAHLGPVEHRARFVQERRVILINLDHPQLAHSLKASGGDIHDERFTSLGWDVAFTEYAVALARLREEAGHYADAEEPLFDVRDTIDRLTRRLHP